MTRGLLNPDIAGWFPSTERRLPGLGDRVDLLGDPERAVGRRGRDTSTASWRPDTRAPGGAPASHNLSGRTDGRPGPPGRGSRRIGLVVNLEPKYAARTGDETGPLPPG